MLHNMNTPSHNRRLYHVVGFTLVELLLVIAIIGLLAGMVLAVTSAIRTSAHTTQCMSNLRQISMSSMSYGVDNGGNLPGPEMWGTSAGYYWWQSIKSFGAEMFSGIYHCPESNYSKREVLSWNQAPNYPAIAFIGALWGRAPNATDYEVSFHGNSYGMNNQCTYGNLGYNAATNNNYHWSGDATNALKQPFPHQNAYSMRANNVSQLVYIADKQARPKAGVVAPQYAQIWPSGLLNDPTKRGQTPAYIRANVIQWGTEIPTDTDDQTVRANHKKRANFVFFDGHVESRDPITGMCENGRTGSVNAYTGIF